MARRFRSSAGWGLVYAWLAALALIRAGTVEERDPYWQVRAGLENLGGAPLRRPDTWSWAPLPEPFIQTSPLWNDILGLSWRGGGFLGLFAVGVVSIGLYLTVAVLLARALGARSLPTLLAFLICFSGALANISPRATVPAQALFLAGILVVHHMSVSSRAKGRAPSLFALTALGLGLAWLGNHLHLSWLVFALISAAAWAVMLLLRSDLSMSRRFSLIGGSTGGFVAGSLLGPYGTEAVAISAHVREQCEGVIAEWMTPFTPGLAVRWVPVLLLAAALCATAFRWLWRHRGAAASPKYSLLAALSLAGTAFTFAGIIGIRFIGIATLTIAPLAAHLATRAVDLLGTRRRLSVSATEASFLQRRLDFWSRGEPWRRVLTVVLVVLSPGIALMTAPLAKPLPEYAVARHLPEGCNLFAWPGSASAFRLLRPDVKPWIDGRVDYFGQERMRATMRHLSGQAERAVPLGTTCVVTNTSSTLDESRLVSRLQEENDWIPVGSSGPMTVWTLSNPKPAS